jgi:hypothetical protein
MARIILILVAVLLIDGDVSAADAPVEELKSPADFRQIRDERTRSVALIEEAGRVLQHPRCVNCHPSTRHPTQGENFRQHVPRVDPGPENRGTKALPCSSCHGKENSATFASGVGSIPGNEHWSLAPASMAWHGLSVGAICEQLKDPARNGNRNLEQIRVHMTEDHLVGWAWYPGSGRKPAPGTQAVFGALISAWIETGAHCPKP